MQKKWLLVFDFQNRSKEISIFFGIFSYRELQTKKTLLVKIMISLILIKHFQALKLTDYQNLSIPVFFTFFKLSFFSFVEDLCNS